MSSFPKYTHHNARQGCAMTRTLLLVFAFLALMIGSFIWFVATWNPAVRAPMSMSPAPMERAA